MNMLKGEASPYLRRHATNPVNWFPWQPIAFETARRLNRPLLISIGYASCHWCHMMAQESFEDRETADFLNSSVVSIKVDREERPDIDAIYLEAVEAIIGRAGWPLTVFATPEGEPFYGGTYFPREASGGIPSFLTVARAAVDTWGAKQDQVKVQARQLTLAISRQLAPKPDVASSDRQPEWLTAATAEYFKRFDKKYKGLSGSKKFPQTPTLELLSFAGDLDIGGCREKLEETLCAMASGGIYDHVGGGFFRYAVDREWNIPHFEKMLCDQALLSRIYAREWIITGKEEWRDIAEETIEYVLRDLSCSGGGFYSSEDADSLGIEGGYYTWSAEDLRHAISLTLRATFEAYYTLVPFPSRGASRNVLRLTPSRFPPRADRALIQSCLRRERLTRQRPSVDQKIVTEWNAMFVTALAEFAGATGECKYLENAINAADFLIKSLRRSDGRWLRSRRGTRDNLALAADHAWLIHMFCSLYMQSGQARWVREAVTVANEFRDLFCSDDGRVYTTGKDGETLIVKAQECHDGVTPSAAAVAALAMSWLSELTMDYSLGEFALNMARSAYDIADSPLAHAGLVRSEAVLRAGLIEVVVGANRRDLVDVALRQCDPRCVIVWGDSEVSPLLRDRDANAAYVCAGNMCHAPSYTSAELLSSLSSAIQVPR